MSIAKKSMLVLTVALITFGYVAPSAALDFSGITGESSDGGHKVGDRGPSSPPPVVVCFYVFGGQICVSGGGL